MKPIKKKGGDGNKIRRHQQKQAKKTYQSNVEHGKRMTAGRGMTPSERKRAIGVIAARAETNKRNKPGIRKTKPATKAAGQSSAHSRVMKKRGYQ